MAKLTNYYIIYEKDMFDLIEKVKQWCIDDGWEPLGAPFFLRHEFRFYQAVVKYED